MFIAYSRVNRKMVHSSAHETRVEAARELLTKFAKLRSCATARAYLEMNGEYKTAGMDAQTFSRYDLPRKKITKAEALVMIRDLYRELNTADHEMKADWMTADLAGENGCALLDKMLSSPAFTDEDRSIFHDTL